MKMDTATDLKVTPALLTIKALSNAIECVGIAGPGANLLPGTLQHLAHLIIDQATEACEALGVL